MVFEPAYPAPALPHEMLNADVTAAAAVDLPPVPIMLATRLRLEKLVMRTPVMDLRAITETILLDPGATVQLLRVVGEEFGDDECRPTRIGHCIASLNRERWYLPVCAWVVAGRDDEVSQAWQQFSLLAHYTQMVAMRLQGFLPEEAYLVGLLHQMGKLPRLLGWTDEESGSQTEERAIGLQLARSWRMPACLTEALGEPCEVSIGSRWNFLLRSAQWESNESRRAESGTTAMHPLAQPLAHPLTRPLPHTTGRPVAVWPRHSKSST